MRPGNKGDTDCRVFYMKRYISIFIIFISVTSFAAVNMTVENDVLIDVDSGVSVELDGNLVETGTGYFNGEITSGIRTGVTNFAGMTLSSSIDGTITRFTGSPYAKGHGEGLNFNRYYEIDNTGSNVVANMLTEYKNDAVTDETNGLSAPYEMFRYTSMWTVYSPGSSTSPIQADNVTIPSGHSDWTISGFGFATVNLTSHNTGDSYAAGDLCTIAWTCTPPGVGTVTLYYSTDGGASFPYLIANGLPNTGSYLWTLPHVTSHQVRLRIEIRGSLLAFDESTLNFTIDAIPPTVILTSPVMNDTLPRGGVWEITWIATDNFAMAPAPIALSFSTDGGITFPHQIATNLRNTGSYIWRLPSWLENNDFQIKVKAWDLAGNSSCGHMAGNAVVMPMGLQLASPYGDELHRGGTVCPVEWNCRFYIGTVSIWYSTDEGRTWPNTIVEGAANTGRYEWTLPELNAENIWLKLSTRGAVQETDILEKALSIDSSPPEVTLLSPTGGELLASGGVCSINWTATDNMGLLDNPISIYYGTDGDQTYPHLIAANEANDGEYIWNIPSNLNDDQIRLKIIATDCAFSQGVDESNQPFAVSPVELALQAFPEGEILRGGIVRTLYWASNRSDGLVDLYYSTDGGQTYPNLIAENEPNDGAYDWTVPMINSQSVKIRVQLTGDVILTAESLTLSAIDSEAPEISLTGPNREKYEAGSSFEIRWETSDNISVEGGALALQLSKDGGATYPDLIYEGTSSDDHFVWDIPADMNNSNLKFKVTVNDAAGWENSTETENSFSVHPLTINLTSPAEGLMLDGGSIYGIEWESNFTGGTVNLYYGAEGESGYPHIIVEGESNDGRYEWKLPKVTLNNVHIKAVLEISTTAADITDIGLGVDYSCPTIELLSPQGGEIWEAASTVPIAWKSEDKTGLLSRSVQLQYSTDAGSQFKKTLISEGETSGSFNWRLPDDLICDNLRLRLSVQNTKGLTGYAETENSIRVINPPPVITDIPDTSFDNKSSIYLDLNQYVRDPNNPPQNLTWAAGISNEKIQVHLDHQNQHCIIVAPDYAGVAELILTVTDPYGASDSDTTIVTATGTTGISEYDTRMPTEFTLAQNYPNPFNPETHIIYGLPKSVDVRITVFDMNGRQIQTLFSGKQTAGYHTVTWHADTFPSGMYVIRMITEGIVKHRKCILMK